MGLCKLLMITPPLMGELGALVVLCAVMAAGTFVTGCLPLFFGLSRIGLRRLELWGSGLLIGAALTVVIPEGITSVYSGHHCPDPSKGITASPFVDRSNLIAACLLGGFMLMFVCVFF